MKNDDFYKKFVLGVLFSLSFLGFTSDPFINLDIKAIFLWILGGVIGVFVIFEIIKIKNSKVNPFSILITVYSIIAIISAIFSVNVQNSITGGWSYRIGLLSILAFIFCANFIKKIESQFILKTAFISSLCIAVYSVFTSIPLLKSGARLIGPVYQSNVLAVILGIGIISAFSLYKNSKTLNNIIIFLGQLFLFLAIFLTKSRLILALVVLSVVAVILLITIKNLKKEKSILSKIKNLSKFKLLAIILSTLLIASGFLYFANLNSSFSRLFNIQLLNNGISYRVHLQEYGVKLLKHTPIFGWGEDSIIFVYDKFEDLPKDIKSSYEDENQHVDSTHNVFLDKFLELGYFGGIAYLLLILYVSYIGIKFSKTLPEKLITVAFIFFYNSKYTKCNND